MCNQRFQIFYFLVTAQKFLYTVDRVYANNCDQNKLPVRKIMNLEPTDNGMLDTQNGTGVKVNGKRRQKRAIPTFNDPRYNDQWHLRTAMNIQKAWGLGYNGSGIIVAIIDTGLEKTHQEFRDRYDQRASYDYQNNDPDPAPVGSDHGNNVAGLAAAEANNNYCGVGIAYKATIGGIRLPQSGPNLVSGEVASLRHANTYIDIYGCAWGPSDFASKVGYFEEGSAAAIKETIEKGRGGKGGIYVFAAGNGGVTFDHCGYDAYVNSIYTISISTLTSSGKISKLSERCSGIMAVTYARDGALGVLSRADPMPTAGLNGGCTDTFSSSSAATGVAAGILALVLQANKGLTWRDVQHLIMRTSNNNPSVLKEEKSDGKSSEETKWKTNGAGVRVHSYYGFGLLDAERLVLTARNWTNVPEQKKCSIEQRGNWVIPHTGDLTINVDFNSWPASCGGPTNQMVYLEHVSVTIDLNFSTRADLEAEVVSPAGTKSYLLRERIPDLYTTSIRNLTVTTIHSWGENPKGQWSIKFRNGNEQRNSSGTLYGVILTLYGTRDDPSRPVAPSSSPITPMPTPTAAATPTPTTDAGADGTTTHQPSVSTTRLLATRSTHQPVVSRTRRLVVTSTHQPAFSTTRQLVVTSTHQPAVSTIHQSTTIKSSSLSTSSEAIKSTSAVRTSSKFTNPTSSTAKVLDSPVVSVTVKLARSELVPSDNPSLTSMVALETSRSKSTNGARATNPVRPTPSSSSSMSVNNNIVVASSDKHQGKTALIVSVVVPLLVVVIVISVLIYMKKDKLKCASRSQTVENGVVNGGKNQPYQVHNFSEKPIAMDSKFV